MFKIAILKYKDINADVFLTPGNDSPVVVIPTLNKNLSINDFLKLDAQGVIVWDNPEYRTKLLTYVVPQQPYIEPNVQSTPQFVPNNPYSNEDSDYPTYGNPTPPPPEQVNSNPFATGGIVQPQTDVIMPLGQFYNQIAEDLDPAPSTPLVEKKSMKPTVIVIATAVTALLLVAAYILFVVLKWYNKTWHY